MGDLNVIAAANPTATRKFLRAVLGDLLALEAMLENNLFESGVRRMGVEQEICLVDQFWHPAPVVEQILAKMNDPDVTTELAKFNLEINFPPLELSGNCFSTLSGQLNRQLSRVREYMQELGGDIILTGILPTIGHTDLSMDNLTPRERYHHLFNMLKKLRGGPFEYYIRGNDVLQTRQENPTFEFCNTSFQVHYQTDPDSFVQAYNFSKMITGPVLAAAVNSPLLLGKRLWAETRIALFEQAIDTRNSEGAIRENRARVSFAREWVRSSILEIFQDDIARFRPLLLAENCEDSMEVLRNGEIPKLKALSIFSGTVYRWNRACYGVLNGRPHLRIENRVLPAGPSVADEVANAAFWLGLMNAMPADYQDLPLKFPFSHAVGNFVNAARSGLKARFDWLQNRQVQASDLILSELLPIANQGLKTAGVDVADRDYYLGVIQERVSSAQTGARWIYNNFNALEHNGGRRSEVLVALTAGIIKRQQEGKPVHAWSDVQLREAGGWVNKFGRVGQVMTTDLFTVQEDDLLDLVLSIMRWKKIHHIPVENASGKLVGLISGQQLWSGENKKTRGHRLAGEIMSRVNVTVSPETPTLEAIELMILERLKCLPVLNEDQLVGIVTEHDFMTIAGLLLKELHEDQKSG